MREPIRFEIGERYENMKGVFEVIAIRRDSMDIRWEGGEEASTSIALQQRIIERMQHEKELEKAQSIQQVNKAKPAASKGGQQFSGLEESDFSTTASKTAWRGRSQLGGAVARRFKNKQFKFNSWAVLRKPETQWLDVKRQKEDDLPLQAKFYARMDDENLYCGFQLPHPEAPIAENSDWHALMAWLRKPENDEWIKKQCASHDLYICDLSNRGFAGRLKAKQNRWEHEQPDNKNPVAESLGLFLKAAGEASTMDLRIEMQMEKAAAVEKRQALAGTLAALFESLMPLYAAAAERQ